MAVDLQINGTSLQNATKFIVSTIGDDSSPGQEINLQKVTRRDGERLVSTVYTPKTITITGRVKGTSLADLENNLDTFKRLCSVVDGRLDIEYAGSFRRFIVGCQSISIQRAHHHLTFAPFSVIFQVYDPPFGLNIASLGGGLAANEAMSVEGIATQAYYATVSFDGSATPKPITRFTLDTVGALAEISERVIGKKNILSVGTAFANGDQIVIDHENQTVLWNGRPVNFEGVFPEYDAGDNTLLSIFDEGPTVIDQQQTIVDDFVTVNRPDQHQFQGFQVSASTSYFQVEVYMRRDINVRSGTVTLDIRNASGSNPGPTTVTNASVAVNVVDIPVDGGWVSFKFTTPPNLVLSTDYRFVAVPSAAVNGNIYIGLSRGNTYGSGVYGYSLNAGSTWKNDPNYDLAFRIWKTSPSINWSVSKKIEYIKRYL